MRFELNRPNRGHENHPRNPHSHHPRAMQRGGGHGRLGGPGHAGNNWNDDGDSMRHGGGPGGGGRGGRFGGGRRGGRMFGGGELRLLLLGLLVEADRHGYELIKAIGDLTGGNYAPSPGVVYPTISLLVDEAMIAEVPGEGARKAFTATEAGRAECATRAEELAALIVRLKTLAEDGERQASPPVMRAMANLKMALRTRIHAEGFDIAIAHQIADVLDEAARRIERL